MVQTQLKTKPLSYSAEVELEGKKWTPGHIFMLYYAV